MKTSFLLLLLLTAFYPSKSQSALQFSGPYPSGYYLAGGPTLITTMETKDGALLTVVNAGVIGSGLDHVLNVTKRNTTGSVLWSYNYTFPGIANYITGMEELPDSGFIFTGVSKPLSIFFKIDKDGILQYSKHLYETPPSIHKFYLTGDVQLLNDSILLFSGEGEHHYFFRTIGYVTLDLQGNVLDQNFYHTPTDSTGNADTASVRACNIIKSQDGGFLLASSIEYNTGPGWTIFKRGFRLTKTDSSGNVLWAHEYNDGNHAYDSNPLPIQIVELSDSTIILCTEYSHVVGPYFRTTMLARMDASGNIIWAKMLDQFIRNAQLFNEGPASFVLTGMYSPQFSDYMNVRFVFDNNGNVLQSSAINESQTGFSWEGMTTRTANNEFISTMLELPGTTYHVVKSSMNDPSLCDTSVAPLITSSPLTFAMKDGATIYNVNLGSNPVTINQAVNLSSSFVYCNAVSIEEPGVSHGNLYAAPNPVSDFLTLNTSALLKATIKLFDVSGRIVFSAQETFPARIDMSGLQSGLYFCSVSDDNETNIIKIIKK